jgi:dihydrofolate synthase/folylpolyglutamate synthase
LVVAIQEFSEAMAVITQRARLLGIPWSQPTGRYGSDRESPYYQDPEGRLIRTNLLGHYQAINLATAWTAILELHRMGWIVDLDQAAQSLKDIRWPGRFEPIQRRPLVVIDGAHNLQAAQALAVTLGSSPWSTYRWHLLFATLADKPGNDMIAALAPLMHSLTITEVSGHRRQTAAELKAPVDPRYPVSVVPDPARAYAEALDKVQQNPAEAALLVTGSLAFLAELRLRHILPEDGGIFH